MITRILNIVIICILLTSVNSVSFAQDSKIDPDGYNVFYYENGTVSSEGTMKNGQPDGYWKTYHENGNIKSEGNRKNFELDSVWTFYNDTGKVILQISYLIGKKNGIRKTFQKDEILEENFKDDIKQGLTRYYYPTGELKKSIVFIDGLEEGVAREYAKDGRVIQLIVYEKGYIIDIENINRYDGSKLKQGKWIYFYNDGNIRLDGQYRNDLKHGYFKDYTREGNLISTTKYVDGVKQEDVAELAQLEIKTDYYPDGNVKIVASYKDNIPEGVRREYSTEGEIVKSYIFKKGQVIGEGIVDEAGMKDGPWKEFYITGALKSEGVYDKGKRIGWWKYYHKNGEVEQEGNFNDEGKADGAWRWYYEYGNLLREENYYNGMEDGYMTEFNEEGEIIAEGEYLEGYKEGEWKYNTGDQKEEGVYLNSTRNGEWKHYFKDGTISFEGSFIEDNPNGTHTWYWDNGNKKKTGRYLMGRKEGEWVKYNYDGTPFISIFYKNGKEIRYDGISVKPDIEPED